MRMSMKHKYIIRCLASVVAACFVLCGPIYAQSNSSTKRPDLQTAEGDIFDPTREQKQTEEYEFAVHYRLTGGYLQQNHRSLRANYPNMYLHGGQIGVTFDFLLPLHFSMQTGLLYSLTYSTREEHWAQIDAADIYGSTNYLKHRVYEHNLTIPIRAYYTIPLIKKFNMFFFGGPQLQIGLSAWDKTDNKLTPMTEQWFRTNGKEVDAHDLYSNVLYRVNIQMGVGGGLEWDAYRLEAGYDFGLNNRVRRKSTSDQHMWEWSWFVRFAYRF